MEFVFSCRKNLLGRTAIVAPLLCAALPLVPAMAQDITYDSGTTLNSASNILGNVLIQPGSNIVVSNPVTLSFNNAAAALKNGNVSGLYIDQNMEVSGPNASITLTANSQYGTQLQVGETPGLPASTLLIDNGAKVNVVNGFAQAAWKEGTTGTITVTGQGSSLTAHGIIAGNGDYFPNAAGSGPAAFGTVNILNGASVVADIVGVANYNSNGVINLSNATLTVNSMLGSNGDGSGQINVNNGGLLVSNGTFYLGGTVGSEGVVNLNQGGVIAVNGAQGFSPFNATPNEYSFNLAGGTLRVINSNLTTNTNFNLVSGTNSTIDTNGYTATLSGTLSGTGGLTKAGAGALILANGQSYTGDTTIIDGDVQYGTPGQSDDYNQATSGPLVESLVTGGAVSSQLQVNGKAILSKALILNLNPPSSGAQYVMGSSYQVLSATGGISGAFSNISSIGPYGPYVTGVLSYNANTVNVQLLASASGIQTSQFYAASGYAQNASLFDAFSAPDGTGTAPWLHGLGSFGHGPGADYNYKGFVAGRGFAVNQNLVLGGAISNIYAHTDGENESYVNGRTIGGQAYGIYTVPRWTTTITGALGHLHNHAERNLPGLGTGDFSTNGVYAGISVREDYGWLNDGPVSITPYAVAKYLHTHLGSGQESGLGGLDTNYGPLNSNLAQAGGGVTWSYDVMEQNSALTTWASLGGLGTLGNTHARVDETIGLQNASVTGEVGSPAMLTSGVGVQLAGNKAPWKVGLAWNGQFANRASGQAFTLNGSYKF